MATYLRPQVPPRTHAQVMRLFAGFELVAPGLVYTSQWRPESPEDSGDHAHHSNLYGALGRKL